jgi:hypothetical protein
MSAFFPRWRSWAARRAVMTAWLRRSQLVYGFLCLLATEPTPGFGHPGHQLAQVVPSPARTVTPAVAATPVRADARLSVTVLDAKTGSPTPVRVRITDEHGKPLGPAGLGLPPSSPAAIEARLAEPGTVIGLPKEAVAVMHGPNDTANGYGFQPNGAFIIRGSFDGMPVPAGKFHLTISKGYEYIELREELAFQPGDHLTRQYEMQRWSDMPARGWYSADDHIHLRRSPRENPLILDWIAAEDVHVGVLLQMGDFWTTYFTQYGFGRAAVYGNGGHLLTSGQEDPRTHELGHTISFGAEQFVRLANEYYAFDKVFDRIRSLNGVSGYAHQAATFHGYRGLALDALGGKVDFLEVMQFCAQGGPLVLEHYYRFLDLGCRLTALGGSDFPWCGRGRGPGEEQVGPRIGDARFYTFVGGELSFERWLAGVKAGNTFITTGPMIELEVNGHRPGSLLELAAGTPLRITARAWGHATQVPLQRLQLVGHSRVLREARAGEPGQSAGELSVELELTPEHGIWIAARADAGPTQMAHTTPVYITINGDGFHTRTHLEQHIALTQKHLDEIRQLLTPPPGGPAAVPPRGTPLPWRYPGAGARLEQRIAETEKRLAELRTRK